MQTQKRFFTIILLFFLFGSGCLLQENGLEDGSPFSDTSNRQTDLSGYTAAREQTASYQLNPEETVQLDGSLLTIHYIDVGQGDSTLIACGGQYMLIDAGENDKASVVTSYLHAEGVEKLEYLIGTHPHSDHIGGMDAVIREFEIGTLIMPEKEQTTKTFEDVLDAAIEKDISITLPAAGTEYLLSDAEFTIVAPNADYKDNLNNWSVGIRLTYGENAFLFTADAETEAEQDILANIKSLSADIFHAGHHGSTTSNSSALLEAVNPEYAIISCGLDNSYGHPHDEILERLDAYGITYYRTDQIGTIIAESDGEHIALRSAEPVPETAPERIVYITKTGESYHTESCSYLSQKPAAMLLEEAIAEGYTPCSRCSPK